MGTKLCCVSIDVDEIHHYFGIHGLKPTESQATLAYDVALPRLAAFADARRMPVSLFAVGADLTREKNALTLAAFARRGHAIENHTASHRYDLTRLSPHDIVMEVEEGIASIERATGAKPTGFRAPGYTVSDTLFDVLEDVGVAFDSSVFPCPAYYMAKATAMGGMRVLARRSRSVLDTPRVLLAPTIPYRPGTPWYAKGGRHFVEVPIQVTPRLRLPFIGTSIMAAGVTGARMLARHCASLPLVNLELHAIDFIDRTEGVEALADHQPELRVPLGARMDALDAALDELQRAGFAFLRLDEAVRHLSFDS